MATSGDFFMAMGIPATKTPGQRNFLWPGFCLVLGSGGLSQFVTGTSLTGNLGVRACEHAESRVLRLRWLFRSPRRRPVRR